MSQRSLRTPAVLCCAARSSPGWALRWHTAHSSPGSRRFPRPRAPPVPAPARGRAAPPPARDRPAPAALSSGGLGPAHSSGFHTPAGQLPAQLPAGGLAFPPPCPEPARAGGGAAGCSMEAQPQPWPSTAPGGAPGRPTGVPPPTAARGGQTFPHGPGPRQRRGPGEWRGCGPGPAGARALRSDSLARVTSAGRWPGPCRSHRTTALTGTSSCSSSSKTAAIPGPAPAEHAHNPRRGRARRVPPSRGGGAERGFPPGRRAGAAPPPHVNTRGTGRLRRSVRVFSSHARYFLP